MKERGAKTANEGRAAKVRGDSKRWRRRRRAEQQLAGVRSHKAPSVHRVPSPHTHTVCFCLHPSFRWCKNFWCQLAVTVKTANLSCTFVSFPWTASETVGVQSLLGGVMRAWEKLTWVGIFFFSFALLLPEQIKKQRLLRYHKLSEIFCDKTQAFSPLYFHLKNYNLTLSWVCKFSLCLRALSPATPAQSRVSMWMVQLVAHLHPTTVWTDFAAMMWTAALE